MEYFVEVRKELRHWPGKLGIYELELCGTKEQFYILFSYLLVASASVSTWALLDLFFLHVQQVLQHSFELFAILKYFFWDVKKESIAWINSRSDKSMN